jgi:hypothetical protein
MEIDSGGRSKSGLPGRYEPFRWQGVVMTATSYQIRQRAQDVPEGVTCEALVVSGTAPVSGVRRSTKTCSWGRTIPAPFSAAGQGWRSALQKWLQNDRFDLEGAKLDIDPAVAHLE